MSIDINQLNESELIDLNRRIVERLRFMQQMRAHVQMLEFKVGDRVEFYSDGLTMTEGVLTKYNKKTVTVISDDGMRWTVPPRLLSRVGEPASTRPYQVPTPRLEG
jgi:hypothetical protein